MRAEAECCLGERVDGARPKVAAVCHLTVLLLAYQVEWGKLLQLTFFITPGLREPIVIKYSLHSPLH